MLQEFQMDHGLAIDIRRGQIAFKCQDVLLAKEKFDKRLPPSRSLFLAKHHQSYPFKLHISEAPQHGGQDTDI
ncbi:hypothetical protein L1987_51018 [Smallanthus sonchifolius]|uniref:Uncharacterized protein n=1 Tax=Smallanthus sonchifolius TaxID=185202 RepID=A0ACB9EPH4_9ASTR|nr:hypothetical protein L1987_51018 [Smallanthus sonchifolius]